MPCISRNGLLRCARLLNSVWVRRFPSIFKRQVPLDLRLFEFDLRTNVHFVTYTTRVSGDLLMSGEFKNEVFHTYEPNPVRQRGEARNNNPT
jgi:hypothetical protein